MTNITLKNNGKLSNGGVWWRKETSAKAVTVQGAAVALEINMQKCRTSTVVPGKGGNHVFFVASHQALKMQSAFIDI